MAKKRGRPPSTIPPAQYVRSVHVKLTEEQYASACTKASSDSRTLANWVRLLIEKAVEEQKGKG
jgi:hypothetical protein